MENSEKRRFKRLNTSIIINYKTVDEAESLITEGDATAINISKTGLLLQTESAIAPHLSLEITMHVSGRQIQLRCRCMYCNETDDNLYESGIHVVKINKKDIKLYVSLLKAIDKSTGNSESLRPATSDIKDLVKRISAEHKIINQYVVVLAKMMDEPSPSPRETETLIRLMKKDIATHFKIEETLFFSVGICTLPESCGEIVSTLTGEHKEIIKTIDILIESIQYQVTNNGPVTPPLKARVHALLEMIKQHAKVELQDLFPLLEENEEVKKMVLAKIMEITKK